jgi:gliding motility-associated-like protein
MLSKYLFILFLCLSPLSIFGQGQTSRWYFGKGAGIQFNNDGSVTSLTDSRINTLEGCASLSDASGNLILYTDGIRVFNKNHDVMVNGTGLYGDPSSTQSAIIVQKPDDPNIIYIFSVDTSTSQNDLDRGLNYSVVDLTLDGGNGAITQKNINLLPDCSEKIAAVLKNCLDQSIWVVTLGPETFKTGPFNTYYAFQVDENGVNTTPVTSTFNNLNIEDPRGYLKFSADGNVLASANGNSGLFIYSFSGATGLLSQQREIKVSVPNKSAYGLEFSPNQQFLYVHTFNDAAPIEVGVHSSSLLQYDITEPNIASTEVELDQRPIYRGALQLGQNGKIYRTTAENYLIGSDHLGVIENPNEKGIAANYIHDAVYLGNGIANQGLPPFVQSFFNRVELIKNEDGTTSTSLSICEGNEFTLEAESIPNATYHWKKNGNPISNATNTLTIAPASFSDSGRYSLEIISNNPSICPIIGEAFISVNAIPNAPTLSLSQCDIVMNNNIDGVTQFNLNEAIFDNSFSFTFYESMADANLDNPIPNPVGYSNTTPFDQLIYYKIVDTNGCENVGELQLIVESIVLTEEDEKYFPICDEDPHDVLLAGFFDLDAFREANYPLSTVSFYPTQADAILEQNPIDKEYISTSTTIFARIEDANACEDVDLINLVVYPAPTLDFMDEVIWCTDGPPHSIDAPDGFDIYRWYQEEGNDHIFIANDQNMQVTSTGNYILEVGNIYPTPNGPMECTNTARFKILPSNKALVKDILVSDISENNMVEIQVSGDGDYEYSLDGISYQDSPLFENVEPGLLTGHVRDKNGCGLSKKMISVIGYPKFFTPNGDGINDSWQIIGINEQFQPESIILIYDRYGKLLAQVSPKTQGWNGMYNNSHLPASDYWFAVTLQDGRVFKGHFTLKR